ncbi:MAG: dTDP-4-dehydrorhamnose reductase [Acidobacteriota bacterium]
MPGPVLIFGGLGQVGQALLAARGVAEAHALGREQVDISDAAAVVAIVDELRPSAVVNCAVFQPVDLCEQQPQSAFAVNAIAAGGVANVCAERSIPLLHLSTDYVFGGDQHTPYAEDDRPRPLSAYAVSKLAGEQLVLAASPAHRVVRTSAVFGRAAEGHGTLPFAVRMLARARSGEPTKVVDDQIVSPTYAPHLAQCVWQLLWGEETGVFHVAGGGECSWYELARRVFEWAGRSELLAATSTAEFGAPARRPAYSALDNRRLRQLGLDGLPSWEEGLATYLDTMRESASS